MAIILKKEEAKEAINQHVGDLIQFIYEESTKSFHVTMSNEKKEISFYGILLEQDGLEVLLDYCIQKNTITLEPFLDTIRISFEGKLLGYLRYTGMGNVINSIPLVVEKFIYQMLETMERRNENVKIIHKMNEKEESLLTLEANKKERFTIIDEEMQTSRIDYLAKEYSKNHPNSKLKETENGYCFPNAIFQKEGLSQKGKDQFENMVLERQMEGYLEGMRSSLLFQMVQNLRQEEKLERERKKKK